MTMSLIRGLLKTAASLNPEEKRRQAMQFAALGLGTVPGLALAQNKIRQGTWLPKSGKGRFLAAAGVGGAFWGGLLPTLQHGIARGNLARAQSRARAEKEMKSLVPGGVAGVRQAVKQLPMDVPTSQAIEDPSVMKTGSSKIMARLKGNLKVRKGRRPIRAETLLKKGSPTGRDLRSPMMGGAKFPTGDSLSQAKQTLKEHQNVAKPKMVQPTVQPVHGVSNMPKFGSALSADPLVQYLKKTAQASKVDSEGKLGDNEGDMKTAPGEKPRVDACPFPSQRGNDKTVSEWRSQLNELFSHKEGITKKHLDKESTKKSS